MTTKKRNLLLSFSLIAIFALTGASYVVAAKKIAHTAAPVAVAPETPLPDQSGGQNTDNNSIVDQVEQKAASVLKEVQADLIPDPPKNTYPTHKNISVTYFWAGEEAGKDNKNISNLPSAWDDQWAKHFGGVDSPKNRNGYMPAGFTPKENPFYFALPFNDFDKNGNRRKSLESVVPWAKSRTWANDESMLKNQWIKITKGGKVAYAQWQDVGPFGENDAAYVFGGAAPKSKTNKNAGLDVSPAVKDTLGLSDVDKVDWQFVDAQDVPDGPWKKIVTSSQVYWQ